MPTELPVVLGSDYAKRLWKKHQDNEYLRVNHYKEGYCFGCFKNRSVGSTIVDICEPCMLKKAKEAILTKIKYNYYGMCFFCNTYTFHVWQINARLCESCHLKVRKILQEYNRRGGMYNVDPFWLSMKRKHGKDWQLMFQDFNTLV